MDAYRGRADEAGDIGGDAARLQMLEILAERGPRDVVLDVTLERLLHHLHGVRERTHRPAFAEDLERDTLPYVALRAAVHDEVLGRPAQHVDDAGRHRHPGDIDLGRGSRGADVANGGDRITLDRDVTTDRRAAATVVDRAVAKDDIVRRRVREATGGQQEECGVVDSHALRVARLRGAVQHCR